MRVITDGEIQSICNECGKDTRNAIELARGVIVPLCDNHMLSLENLIHLAYIPEIA